MLETTSYIIIWFYLNSETIFMIHLSLSVSEIRHIIKRSSIIHNGILHSRKKEGASTLCDSMDGTGEHYAKWNKTGGEGQVHMISPISGT